MRQMDDDNNKYRNRRYISRKNNHSFIEHFRIAYRVIVEREKTIICSINIINYLIVFNTFHNLIRKTTEEPRERECYWYSPENFRSTLFFLFSKSVRTDIKHPPHEW